MPNLSRFAKRLELKPGVVALFNSLLCEPLYASPEEADALWAGALSKFDSATIRALTDAGLIVATPETDQLALETLRARKKAADSEVSLLYLMPTSACNLACSYCFIGKLDDRQKQRVMTWEIARTAIDKFTAHVQGSGVSAPEIIFYGAEPTIAWDLVARSARYVREWDLDLKLTILTNGTLLDEGIVREMKSLGMSVGVSLDGPKDVTNANRPFKGGQSGVYERAVHSVRLLQECRVPVALSVTVSESVLDDQQGVLRWLVELGAPVSFNLLHYTTVTADWRKYYTEASAFLLAAYEQLKEHGLAEGRVDRKIDAFHNRRFKFADCGASGANQVAVGPGGEVFVCHGYWNSGEHRCGHILDDDYEDLFRNEEYRAWRDNVTLNKPECVDCEALFICGGGCPMQAETLFGDTQAVDRSFCIHSKSSLEWLLRRHFES